MVRVCVVHYLKLPRILTKYHSKYRSSPRTKGIIKYELECLDFKADSNFISHLDKCRNLPESESFATHVATKDRENHGLGPLAAPPTSAHISSSESHLSSNQGIMGAFLERGKTHPERIVTKKVFRENFVKAIIVDDLPFSFGEKIGMKSCFEYVIPRDYKVPNHQMVRRDLDIMYDCMSTQLNLIILVSQTCVYLPITFAEFIHVEKPV